MPERVCADLVFVCECLGAGGIQRVVSILSNEWSRRGRKVCVVTRLDRRFFTLDGSVKHVVFQGDAASRLMQWLRGAFALRDLFLAKLRRSPLANWWLARVLGQALYVLLLRLPLKIYLAAMFALDVRALRRILVRVNTPIVVSMGTPLNVITLVATKGLARRVVISERGDARAMHMNWLWGELTAKLYERAYLVTANSRALVRHMRGFVGGGNLAFLPNPMWVERGHGSDREYDSTTAPVVLSVARLVPEKAPDVLLDAFALCAEEHREWRLALVGEGQLETALRAQAARLGIAEQIDWCGLVKDPLPHYDTAQVFVLPSRIEGMPNALLEAMGCGVPVIVSDGTPGLLEVVEHGITGLVVPVNDAAALAAALRLMLSDAPLRRRLGTAARERVLEYELSRSLASWESALGLAS
ncbi:MAG: GalNAc-alpha-(1-_4)-GalNAc-alpha-(1-_3)-diNAcBac-PP-undecaprenol [Bradyrhizobium sp.]|jgi:glycosyltransferase involved in cell wall biosynthesis|nr:GalNAc-alpha-(1->4)-GalNAc-alpha-(1->3)-diNAcBac-PP-undecaprenol [Bradyrhizobium sp.]